MCSPMASMVILLLDVRSDNHTLTVVKVEPPSGCISDTLRSAQVFWSSLGRGAGCHKEHGPHTLIHVVKASDTAQPEVQRDK